jgi:AraC family transcriptional regulator
MTETGPAKATTRAFYESAVEKAVRAILTQLDEALDLTVLARGVGLSPFHFHRIFRGMLGETPLEMQRRLRLERAARQLLTTDLSVTAIAFDAGYETHEAFTRAFRQGFGTSPSGFREQGKVAREGCARPLSPDLVAPSGVHAFREAMDTIPITFLKGDPLMKVAIETLPATRVAALRHVGPYNRIGETFARLGAFAGPAGLFGPKTQMIGIYHDDPETVPAAELRSEAGLSVAEGVPIPSGLIEILLPAGRYAHVTHAGSYETLGDTWARFMGQWLPDSGHRMGSSPSFEIYRNTPGDVPAEELRTELYIPVA